MTFNAEENLFEAGKAVFNIQRQLKTLRTMANWIGNDNAYAIRGAFIHTSNPQSMGRVDTLQDWYRHWGSLTEVANSKVVETGFDPDLIPADQSGKPKPEDFQRFAEASGVPINLELVGPSGYQSGTEGSIEYRDWKKRCEEVFG